MEKIEMQVEVIGPMVISYDPTLELVLVFNERENRQVYCGKMRRAELRNLEARYHSLYDEKGGGDE